MKEQKEDARVDHTQYPTTPLATASENQPIPTTYDSLLAALVRLRDQFAVAASQARKTDAGTGSRWELSGYADILGDMTTRVSLHHIRVIGVDRQIARMTDAANQGDIGRD